MGGRGSSSGMSDKPYGTEYETLYQSGNIKFVRYKNGAATTPAETMTNGRVYVTVNARDKIKSITYYDNIISILNKLISDMNIKLMVKRKIHILTKDICMMKKEHMM